MWISPLIGEFVFRWQLFLRDGWILGVAGFDDVLFLFGFASLITLVIYHSLMRVILPLLNT
jgi:hypothetical protein